MNRYEELTQETTDLGLIVKEKPLKASDGRIKRNRVAIRSTIPTTPQRACVLAEELGHYCTSVGNITDQSKIENRKQERQARLYAYNKLIGLRGLIQVFEKRCLNCKEMAQELDVTEEFLQEAIDCYTAKYGECATVDNYVIAFIPNLRILKLI